MASAFASQLREIAANSSHELDLRARRTAHAESLLFSREVAAKQDFDTIFAICYEGFQELCSLDDRFRDYERNLFSPHAKDQDRDQMNASENEALNTVIEHFLGLVGGRVLLRPGVQALEWLVRRFRVHVHNTRCLLLTSLPYHEMPIWKNVLSIIAQEKVIGEWKFIRPYLQTTWIVPRHSVVYALTNDDGLFAALNKYVLDVCRDGTSYPALMRFWGSVAVEAVSHRFDQARSGRKEVHRQRLEDALLKVLPVLSEGFEISDCDSLTLSCYTIAMVVASKGDLPDRVLDSLLYAVADTINSSGVRLQPALSTLAVLAGQKEHKTLPKPVINALTQVPNFEDALNEITNSQVSQILLDAIVAGIMMQITKKNSVTYLRFLEQVLRLQIHPGRPGLKSSTLKPVLSRVLQLNKDDTSKENLRVGLIELLRRLNEEETLASVLSDSTLLGEQDLQALEALLGSTLLPPSTPNQLKLKAAEEDATQTDELGIDDALASIPSRTADISSFLSSTQDRLYEQLRDLFLLCQTDASVQAFKSLPIWTTSNTDNLLFGSFLLRFACEPHTSLQRARAVRLLSAISEESPILDTRLLLPYMLILLADPAQNIRKATAGLITSLVNHSADISQQDVPDMFPARLMEKVQSVSRPQLNQVIQRVILPVLEECILDPSRISKLIGFILNGETHVEVKKNSRHSLFDVLSFHAIATMSLRVKMGVINLLEDVQKVGSENKSKSLSPMLEEWSRMDQASAVRAAERESVDVHQIDATFVSLYNGRNMDLLNHITTVMVDEKNQRCRSDLIQAFFERIETMWKSTKDENRLSITERLFSLAFSENEAVSQGASATLQNVSLTSEILNILLSISIDELANLQTETPPKKRRRTSQNEKSRFSQLSDMSIARLTFSLELTEGSKPETKPELLPKLFDALAALKHMKQLRVTDSPYLLNACLSSILAIVEKVQSTSKTINVNGIRTELVTETVRDCENPQVLNTALLVAASLSSLVPDRMVHDIMPVFTFVSQKMFAKDDEHSVYVMNRAVDQIVPVLVASLRKTKQTQNLLLSVANLLTSFISAFDHIPQHRKVAFYQRILMQVGAEDFGFILLAMLSVRKDLDTSFVTFVDNLLDGFSTDVRLKIYTNLIILEKDIFAVPPRSAESVLGVSRSSSEQEKESFSYAILRVAKQILTSKSLKSQLSKVHRLDATSVEQIWHQLEVMFGLNLAAIHDHKKRNVLSVASKDCLEALLDLMSLRELIQILPKVVQEIDNDLKPQSLRTLSFKMKMSPVKDSKTRVAAIDFLGVLSESLNGDLDSQLQQATLVCIDQLIETFGRKDPDAVIAAANSVVKILPGTPTSLKDHADYQNATVAVLTLATAFEVLKEAALPIVPGVLPLLQTVIDSCIPIGNQRNLSLFNAACTLTSTILSHLAFMVGEDQLATLLKSITGLETKSTSSPYVAEGRADLMRTIARKTDFETVVQALVSSYTVGHSFDSQKMCDSIDLLSQAVEKASKSTVIRHADSFSELFLRYLQGREEIHLHKKSNQSEISNMVEEIESRLQDVSIKFIYKLNDSVFRPIFESWVEWPAQVEEDNEKTLRQTSLFNILIHFFQTLKAIVTSYASFVLKPISTNLSQLAALADTPSPSLATTPEQQNLFTSVLSLLRATAVHDADGFYTAPSHFDPIAEPLVHTLQLATHKPLRPLIYTHIIPTIVSLASATIDSPSHHHTLSHLLTQLRRHSSAHVRLASIKTLHALIDDEEEAGDNGVSVGNDWIANTIGVGSGEGEGARGGGGAAGEVMIYVNEMLEDDDEDVEREVRRWVQRIRDRVGEDVFEV